MRIARAHLFSLSIIVFTLICIPVNLIAQSNNVGASALANETIEHLIDYVAKSGLIFIRNGAEHDSKKAAEHLQNKYNYLKNSISTPDEFIEKAATKSSLTGEAYLVKLADGTQQKLGEWLSKESESYSLSAMKK